MEKKFDTPWREGGQYMTDMAKEGRLIDAVKLAVRGGVASSTQSSGTLQRYLRQSPHEPMLPARHS